MFSAKETAKHLILWGISQFCRLPIPMDRLRISDKFYYKLRPKQTIRDLKVGNCKVRVNLAEFHPRLMYFHCYEAEIVKFVANNVKKGQTCLDIGANIGYISATMAKCVGVEGKVYSFEPNSQIFSSLESLAQSSKEVITPFQVATSDREGFLEIYFEENHALSTCVEGLQSQKAKKLKVKTVSIDDFCSQKNISPDFIKIDVEGAEPFVLKGMQELLRSGKRPIILCELKPWTYESFGVLPDDVINSILKHNYRACVLDDRAKLIEITVAEICKAQTDVNAIFLPIE